MQLIEQVTVGSGGVTEIIFDSIPDTFTDLCLTYSLRLSGAGIALVFFVELNDTTPTTRSLVGNGSSASSITQATYYALTSGNAATANTFGNGSLYIPNYTGTAQKSVSMDMVSETDGTSGFQVITAGLYNVTSAVTKVNFKRSDANLFMEHSSVSLYGITAGSDGITAVS